MLKQDGSHFFTLKNKMIFYHIIQGLYLFGVYSLFSIKGFWFAIIVGIIAFLFSRMYKLYRTLRFKGDLNKSGDMKGFSCITPRIPIIVLVRITLYELTRHSDHHYKSSKKYQTLKSYEESPTLPLGYPASILLSFIPPLWYWVMNPRVPSSMKSNLEDA